MRHYFLFFLLSIAFISCDDKPDHFVDLTGIEVDFELERFDQDFYLSKEEDLPVLKNKYPLLFPANTPDSVWLAKINDQDEQDLFKATQEKYSDFNSVQLELENLFKHIKYYNSNFKAPNVITVLSNVDYEYRSIYSNGLLFISIDVYLGNNSPFYADYPDYIKVNNIPDRIVVDAANQIINTGFKQTNNRSFLSKMIHLGKKLYALDLYLPSKSDQVKIGYSIDKYNWAEANESEIWRYFLENDLLYSTDTKLNTRFLDEAPFSKFYLAQDSQSPGRIGEWIGWQIVRSFMENNDVSLQTLMTMNEEEIFNKSKYKPRK